MPTPYTSAIKQSKNLLIHSGGLIANSVSSVIPAEFINVSGTPATAININSIGIGSVFVPPFTHFDAGVMQASNYDELLINIQPTLTVSEDTGILSISTSLSIYDYCQIAESGRPFWLIIDTKGYGLPSQYVSATKAINTAQLVMETLWQDMLNFQITTNFQGFAFVGAELNNVFTNGSSITRTMQNQLVQECWELNRAACFITERPADFLTLIAPTLENNTNSNLPLAHPILGCEMGVQDKIIIVYPNIQKANQNISVTIGQLSATLSPTNRDPGFTPNISYAYAVPVDDDFWIADGTGGVSSNNTEENISNIFNFVAAFGIREFALFTITDTNLSVTGYNFPSPWPVVPPDSNINITGSANISGDGGYVFVSYSDGTNTTVRKFDSKYVESAYSGNTFP